MSPNAPDVPVGYYRKDIFYDLEVNPHECAGQPPFKLSRRGVKDNELTATSAKPMQADTFAVKDLVPSDGMHLYYGKQSLDLNHEWQPLVSLSPEENMTHYHIEPFSEGVEVRYSQYDNQTYIRSTSGIKRLTVDFLVEVPSTSEHKLPADIQALVDEFKRYEVKALDLEDRTHLTGEDYLKAITSQRKGSCRHRAVAFKYKMAKLHPELLCRVIHNKLHLYAEVYVYSSKRWMRCDLGGRRRKLVVKEPFKPTKTPAAKCARKPSSSSRPQPSQELPLASLNHLLDLRVKPSKEIFTSVGALYQTLLKQAKSLIYTEKPEQTLALLYALQATIKKEASACFIINHPDDIEDEELSLHAFLEEAHSSQRPAVLLINYDHFSDEDFASLSELLGRPRKLKGVVLPDQVSLLGVFNHRKTNAYHGDDFHACFDQSIHCSLKEEVLSESFEALSLLEGDKSEEGILSALSEALSLFKENERLFLESFNTWSLLEENKSIDESRTVINLFHHDDWKQRLFGGYQLHGHHIVFIKGLLQTALEQGKPITLINLPLQDQQFFIFWQQALISGMIHYEGQSIRLTSEMTLVKNIPYQWELLCSEVQYSEGLIEKAETLNAATVESFYSSYDCDQKERTLRQFPGILMKNTSCEVIDLNVTGPLREDQWAELFSIAHQYNKQLKLHIAPGLQLPEALAEALGVPQPSCEEPPSIDVFNHTQLIVTNDIDAYLSEKEELLQEATILHCSELDVETLLISIHAEAKKNEKDNVFTFKEQMGILLEKLNAGETVILAGPISNTLAEGLTDFLLKRLHQSNAPGRLYLMNNTSEGFEYLPKENRLFDPEAKKALLYKTFERSQVDALDEKLITQESFCHLQTRLQQGEDAWKGLTHLDYPFSKESFEPSESEAKAEAFNRQRLGEVFRRLDSAPYLYLAGLTGVGKTTFVEKYLGQADCQLHLGIEQAQHWADDIAEGVKVLFIDEANLKYRNWSEFEGLFNEPPSIIIDGKYHLLTKNHKVIFAGNPLDYGAERKLSSLFDRHANVMVFEPLPSYIIYEEILKPVFENTPLSDEAYKMSRVILEVYHYLCEQSTTHVLVTPRELQMMALMMISHSYRFPCQDSFLIAQYYAHQLGRTLAPSIGDFNQRFEPVSWGAIRSEGQEELHEVALREAIYPLPLTISRHGAIQQLVNLLALRNYREDFANEDVKRYGGLGGVLIEGEPDTGKMSLVKAMLEQSDTPFCEIASSTSVDEKTKRLLRAFDQGEVVVIKNINCSPLLESLLNDLLMGKRPDGQRPKKPGFMVIGTQQPISKAGRRKMSPALTRRLLKIHLPPYTQEDTQAIFEKYNRDPEQAKALAEEYQLELKSAKSSATSPLKLEAAIGYAKKQGIQQGEKRSLAAMIGGLGWCQKRGLGSEALRLQNVSVLRSL